MDNIWLLTEERPKPSVVKKIIETYCTDFNDTIVLCDQVKIKPLINGGVFQFAYVVEGLKVAKAEHIYIKTVSGYSSFLDFLLFKQENEPRENDLGEIPLMAVEETKTSDKESRNTGVSQRVSKFVYFRNFYKRTKMYMLYNGESKQDEKPSQTGVFGTNILLSLGVSVVGKDVSKWYKKFASVDDLIDFKAKMKKPPKGNVPIEIKKQKGYIEVSGRLDKPAGKGNIAHDPSVGSLSMIGAGLRKLGWTGDIILTKHGVSSDYIGKNKKNKFLFNCQLLDMKLEGLSMPQVQLPEYYWHYERNSEKMADILLHIQAIYGGMNCVYENHAGCERGYFNDKNGIPITLPKKNREDINLFLPDVVLYDAATNYILLVEGKKASTLKQGLAEIENYDGIEQEYIVKHYPGAEVLRCLSIFGASWRQLLNPKVLFYLASDGHIIINANAPECVKRCFKDTGVTYQ